MTERMTESREAPRVACRVGSATDNPCPREAVLDGRCERHLAYLRMREAIEEAEILLAGHLEVVKVWADER